MTMFSSVTEETSLFPFLKGSSMVRTASTMLPLGTQAPAFSLHDTDGNTVKLSELSGSKALLVIFMCNHCPYVKAKADALNELF